MAEASNHAPHAHQHHGVVIYEVDEYGTLFEQGAQEPTTNQDLHPDLDPNVLFDAEDLIGLLEESRPACMVVEQLLLEHLQDLEDALEHPALDRTTRAILERELESCQFMRHTDATLFAGGMSIDDVSRVRQRLIEWLSEPIDEVIGDMDAVYASVQYRTLKVFEAMSADRLDELGVRLVHGEYPGSTYYAAELAGDLATANVRAEAMGLSVRFVSRAGPSTQVSDRREDEGFHTAARAEATARDAGPEPAVSGSPLEQFFVPTFGVEPALRLGRPVEPTMCVALPPKPLRQLHDVHRLRLAWDRALRAIRSPAQVVVDEDGNRHVHVLGCGVHSFDPQGLVRCHLWCKQADGRYRLVEQPTSTMSIDGVPHRRTWIALWERGFVDEICGDLSIDAEGPVRESVVDYARWVFDRFRSWIRRGCDLRVMRSRIARALAVDARCLSIARQVRMVTRREVVRVDAYNNVLRNRLVHEKLAHDAPDLSLAFELLARTGRLPAQGEPLERIRQLLERLGLTTRTWRMLLRSRAAFWRPMASSYSVTDGKAVVDYLQLVDRLGWRKPADPAFMSLLLSFRGGPATPREHYCGGFRRSLPILQRVVAWYEAADQAERHAMLEGLHAVVTWLDDGGHREHKGGARLPKWRTLVRRAQAHLARQLALQQQDHASWVTELERQVIDGFEFLPANTAEGLMEEGQAMHHCVFDFVDQCARRTHEVVSIRDAASGRRVATLLCRRANDRWVIDQLAGFANRLVQQAVSDATLAYIARHASALLA